MNAPWLIQRDGGTVALFGRDPADEIAALEEVAGFVESPGFYPYLSGQVSGTHTLGLDYTPERLCEDSRQRLAPRK